MNDVKQKKESIKAELEAKVKASESLSGYQLQRADLSHTNFVHVDLSKVDFSRADLSHTHMYGANLCGANLFKANLKQANLKAADLRGCNFLGAYLEGANLENVNWNDGHKMINELEADEVCRKGDRKTALIKYKEAEDIYRNIKLCHRAQGHSKEESLFFYREMVVHRKQLPYFSWHRIGSKLVDLISGYGEKPVNVIITMISLICFCSLVYGFIGVSYKDAIIKFGSSDLPFFSSIANLIYFSTVVFTTVGFGDITPLGFGKLVMMIEGFLGQILMAFFIVTLYRRLISR